MKKIGESEIETKLARSGDARSAAADTARAVRVAYDDRGRVKYAAEVELSDGQVVGYSRADGRDFDADELEAAMLGVIESSSKPGRVK